MKPSLSESNIKAVRSVLSGKKLEKFNLAVELVNQSLEAEGWVLNASRKAASGFGQGIMSGLVPKPSYPHSLYRASNELGYVLRYGTSHRPINNVEEIVSVMRECATPKEYKNFLKLSVEVIQAWVSLLAEFKAAREWLDSSRPLPVVTLIGTSPTVLKTLEDMGLHLTGGSLKFPKYVRVETPYEAANVKGGMQTYIHVHYEIVWEEGIKHNNSRFSGCTSQGHNRCQACGHAVPSGRLVPLEGKDSNGQWFSIWCGTDCAKTLFGVKDVGFKFDTEAEIAQAKLEAEVKRETYMRLVGR